MPHQAGAVRSQCSVSPVQPDHHGEEVHYHYQHYHSLLQRLLSAIKRLVVLLVLPSVTPILWRLHPPGMTTNPIREITSRLFHMGQTVVRMVGSLSGNHPSPHRQRYQHHHHHHLGKVISRASLEYKYHFPRQHTGVPGLREL